MNQAAFAKLAGVSRKTVTKWKQQGYVVLNRGGLVDVERSIALLRDRGLGNFRKDRKDSPSGTDVTQTTAPAAGRQSGDDEEGNCQPTPEEIAAAKVAEAMIGTGDYALLSIAEAERLKENFLALKNRLSYERDAGRLVDKAEVEARFAERWAAERVAWENRPSAVAAEYGAQHGIDPIKMRVILEQFVEEHLAERVDAAERTGA